jgi:hypothetical protein
LSRNGFWLVGSVALISHTFYCSVFLTHNSFLIIPSSLFSSHYSILIFTNIFFLLIICIPRGSDEDKGSAAQLEDLMFVRKDSPSKKRIDLTEDDDDSNVSS